MLSNVVNNLGVNEKNRKEFKKLLVKTPNFLDFLNNVDKLNGEELGAALKSVVEESGTKNKKAIINRVIELFGQGGREGLVGKFKSDVGVSAETMEKLVELGLVKEHKSLGPAVHMAAASKGRYY